MDWCQPQTRGSTRWENHKIKSKYDNIIQSMNVGWSQSHPITHPPNQRNYATLYKRINCGMPYIRNKLFFLIFWKLWTEWKDCWLECLWWQQLCEEHGWDWELISAICLVVCFSKSKIDREFQRFVVSSQKVNAFPRILAWGHRSRLLSVGWTWHWYGLVYCIADSNLLLLTIITPFDDN